ncbi:MAG: hypothetical protein ACRDGQ_08930, partial [Candidatus Limnocylindrales bacterium]
RDALMPWATAIVEAVHILFAITWFGAVLTAQLVTHPALERLPPTWHRMALTRYSRAAKRIIRPAVLGVIVLGVLRGTAWGPIQSVTMLTSMYGLTWLASLLLTIGLYVWGRRVMTRGYLHLIRLPEGAELDPDGQASPALLDAVRRLQRNGRLQLVGFVFILGCMVLMRFGF